MAATRWPLCCGPKSHGQCVRTVDTNHYCCDPAAFLSGWSDEARDMRLRCNTVNESHVTRGAPVSRIKAAPILIGRAKITASCWPFRLDPPSKSLCVGTSGDTTRLRLSSNRQRHSCGPMTVRSAGSREQCFSKRQMTLRFWSCGAIRFCGSSWRRNEHGRNDTADTYALLTSADRFVQGQ